jgi:hypothetical protein
MPTTKAIGKTKAKCTKCCWKSIPTDQEERRRQSVREKSFSAKKIAKKCTLCLIESNLALPKNVKFICKINDDPNNPDVCFGEATPFIVLSSVAIVLFMMFCSDGGNISTVSIQRRSHFGTESRKPCILYHDGGHHGRSGWYYAQDINGACHNVWFTAQVLQWWRSFGARNKRIDFLR